MPRNVVKHPTRTAAEQSLHRALTIVSRRLVNEAVDVCPLDLPLVGVALVSIHSGDTVGGSVTTWIASDEKSDLAWLLDALVSAVTRRRDAFAMEKR